MIFTFLETRKKTNKPVGRNLEAAINQTFNPQIGPSSKILRGHKKSRKPHVDDLVLW